MLSLKNMKKIKLEDWELKEIGEMVVELLERGQSFEFTPLPPYGKFQTKWGVRFNVPGIDYLAMKLIDEDFVEMIGDAVDELRKENLEPTRAEEINNLVEMDNRWGEVGLVSGKCACGSIAPLIIKRQIYLRASWQTDNVYYSGDLNELPAHCLKGLEVPLMKDEIGTCPKCKRNYKFEKL